MAGKFEATFRYNADLLDAERVGRIATDFGRVVGVMASLGPGAAAAAAPGGQQRQQQLERMPRFSELAMSCTDMD